MPQTKRAMHPNSLKALAPTQFKPGNPGKPRGTRNKLDGDFVSALQADFSVHGTSAIVATRESRPWEYLRIIVSVLPKQQNLDVSVDANHTFQKLLKIISDGKFENVVH